MVKSFIAFLLILILSAAAYAAPRLHLEKVYQKAWCDKAKGQMEYKLRDGTRVDCLTTNYAIEVEFADKWYQSVGQALHYARLTGEQPAVLLIIEQKSDWKHYWQLKKIAKKNDIKIWYIKPEDLNIVP